MEDPGKKQTFTLDHSVKLENDDSGITQLPDMVKAKVMTNNEYGFSLFELLIVLTLIGILTAIAYPVYRHALIKTRRTEAKIALINLANRMEIYYLENNNSYVNAKLAKLGVNPKTDKGFYKLSITSTNNTYQLSAIANFNDPSCYKLMLNELGEKSSEPGGIW